MTSVPMVALGDVANILSGFAFDSGGFGSEGGIPVVRIRDVVRGTSSTFFNGPYDPRFVVMPGDLLIGMDGEFNCARWAGGAALLNQRVSKIEPADSRLDAGYLRHYLPQALKVIEDATPFVTVKHLSTSSIRTIAIPLPPVPTQRRIAEVLDRADALRFKRRDAIAHLDTLTYSIFLDMFGDASTNPKGWPLTHVGEIADVQGGLQLGPARNALPRQVPYLRVANVYRGALDLSEIKSLRATDAEVARTELKLNDLLLVEGHGNPDEIGRCARWDGSIPGCVHQNHLIRLRFDQDGVVPTYACHYLNSRGGRRHLIRSGKSTSGLNTINVSEVRATPIAIPPLPIQQDFSQRVDAVEDLKRRQAEALHTTDALFGSLQHRAFRGEL